MEYKKLLARAVKNLPEKSKSSERFEIPKCRGHIEGNKTVVSNFGQIADALQRPVEHFLKYILKELATPGEMRGTALILGTKTGASRINEKIKQYAEEFVVCKECGKPDTKIVKEGQYSFMRCMACGAKHPVKSKI